MSQPSVQNKPPAVTVHSFGGQFTVDGKQLPGHSSLLVNSGPAATYDGTIEVVRSLEIHLTVKAWANCNLGGNGLCVEVLVTSPRSPEAPFMSITATDLWPHGQAQGDHTATKTQSPLGYGGGVYSIRLHGWSGYQIWDWACNCRTTVFPAIRIIADDQVVVDYTYPLPNPPECGKYNNIEFNDTWTVVYKPED